VNFLLVTFSLRNAEKDYSDFFVTLRGNAQQWWHFIEQTCIVTTFHDPNTLAHALLPYIEGTDSLLVVKIVPGEFQGWLPKQAWDWMNDISQKIKQPILPSQIFPPPKKLGS
jgi:hypothetical protein